MQSATRIVQACCVLQWWKAELVDPMVAAGEVASVLGGFSDGDMRARLTTMALFWRNLEREVYMAMVPRPIPVVVVS